MYSTTQAYTPGKNLDATRSLLIGMKEKGTLQSYVAQHKNSPEYPYLLALASSINQISDATKAAEHQPAPHTVADQTLGALAPAPTPQPLPENVGIGQLPTPNMETIHKASGGIIAFDEGGHVPRYNGSTSDGSQVASSPFGDLMSGIGGWFSRVGNPATNPRAQLSTLQAEKARAEQGFFEALTPQQKAERSAQVQQLDAKIKEVQSSLSGPKPFEPPASTPTGPSPSNADIEKNILGMTGDESKTAAADKASTNTQRPPSAGAPTTPGIDSLMESAKKYFPKGEEAPSDRTGFMKEREAVRAPVYEKMDKMIEDEKGKLKGDREQAFFMSMIEGGLAAAGGTSQYGLQNLAQGFSKGTASFGEALKDIRKAAKENAKMEIEAQRMRSADKIGDMDAFQRSEEAYKQRQATRDAAMTSGVFALTGDKMRADATIKAAGITASAPGAQERLLATLGGGDVAKGLKLYQEAQTDKTGVAMMQVYSTAAANAAKLGEPMPDPITFAQNMQLYMAAMQGGGFQSKPGDTPVRKLPGT